MVYRWLADVVLLLHGAFVAFVVLGGLLVLRWPRLAWLHLPAAAWGAAIALVGGICPLTPLENHWRRLAGEQGYPGGFVENYLLAALYPEGLTRGTQALLGLLVIAINAAVYQRLRKKKKGARRR